MLVQSQLSYVDMTINSNITAGALLQNMNLANQKHDTQLSALATGQIQRHLTSI